MCSPIKKALTDQGPGNRPFMATSAFKSNIPSFPEGGDSNLNQVPQLDTLGSISDIPNKFSSPDVKKKQGVLKSMNAKQDDSQTNFHVNLDQYGPSDNSWKRNPAIWLLLACSVLMGLCNGPLGTAIVQYILENACVLISENDALQIIQQHANSGNFPGGSIGAALNVSLLSLPYLGLYVSQKDDLFSRRMNPVMSSSSKLSDIHQLPPSLPSRGPVLSEISHSPRTRIEPFKPSTPILRNRGIKETIPKIRKSPQRTSVDVAMHSACNLADTRVQSVASGVMALMDTFQSVFGMLVMSTLGVLSDTRGRAFVMRLGVGSLVAGNSLILATRIVVPTQHIPSTEHATTFEETALLTKGLGAMGTMSPSDEKKIRKNEINRERSHPNGLFELEPNFTWWWWFKMLLVVGSCVKGALGGLSAFYLGRQAYLADCVPADQRARVFALFSGISVVGWVVGPLLGGLVAARWSNYALIAISSIALAAVSIPVWMLPEPTRLAGDQERNTAPSWKEAANPLSSLNVLFRQPDGKLRANSPRLKLLVLILMYRFISDVSIGVWANNVILYTAKTFTWTTLETGVYYGVKGAAGAFSLLALSSTARHLVASLSRRMHSFARERHQGSSLEEVEPLLHADEHQSQKPFIIPSRSASSSRLSNWCESCGCYIVELDDDDTEVVVLEVPSSEHAPLLVSTMAYDRDSTYRSSKPGSIKSGLITCEQDFSETTVIETAHAHLPSTSTAVLSMYAISMVLDCACLIGQVLTPSPLVFTAGTMRCFISTFKPQYNKLRSKKFIICSGGSLRITLIWVACLGSIND
jgi:MFS family permease